MKAVFIVYNQAYYMEISEDLENLFQQRGYTMWSDISGRGSRGGEPHEGNHAWPTMNNAMLTVVEDDKVDGILDLLRQKDTEAPGLGLRAFVWDIEKMY